MWAVRARLGLLQVAAHDQSAHERDGHAHGPARARQQHKQRDCKRAALGAARQAQTLPARLMQVGGVRVQPKPPSARWSPIHLLQHNAAMQCSVVLCCKANKRRAGYGPTTCILAIITSKDKLLSPASYTPSLYATQPSGPACIGGGFVCTLTGSMVDLSSCAMRSA